MTQTVQAEMQASDNIGANLIINGDMRIAQRGTSFVSPSNGNYLMDRWAQFIGGATVWTITQDTDVPTVAEAGVDFNTSMKIDVTTADASIAAGDLAFVTQKIEGLNWAQLGYGATGAKDVTVSFWLKSDTKTGVFGVSIRNSAVNRSYPVDVTISDNNWNKYTVTIPGDTSGTWLTTNGIGAYIGFTLAAGADYQSTGSTWSAANGICTSNQDNFVDSATNNIWITGVKLEVGSTATDFVPDDYATALAKCQRYYVEYVQGGTQNMTGFAVGINNFNGDFSLAQWMRASPTVDFENDTTNWETFTQGPSTETSLTSVTGFLAGSGTSNIIGWAANKSSAWTAGDVGQLRVTSGTEKITIDAEL